MRRLILSLAIAAGLAMAGATPSAVAQDAEDNVVWYDGDDKVMNKAVADAQASLPVFWRALDRKHGSNHVVKVSFPTPDGGHEHLWVMNVERTAAGALSGILDNEPQAIEGMKVGDRVTFSQSQISDWAYDHDGRMWGGYTLRVMLKDVSPEQAAEMRDYLSPTPLEPGTR